jgi:hypothetical protein
MYFQKWNKNRASLVKILFTPKWAIVPLSIKSKPFTHGYPQYPYKYSTKSEGLHLKTVGGVSRTNDIPDM